MTKSKSRTEPKAQSNAKPQARLHANPKVAPTYARGTAKPKLTKADAILKLLRSKSGASIEEMTKAAGWQAHSIRGFLSGTVKKRMGITVTSAPDKEGVRRYRIASPAATARPNAPESTTAEPAAAEPVAVGQ